MIGGGIVEVPKVYLDANIYKFSATKLRRIRHELRTYNNNGNRYEEMNYSFVEINPNDAIRDENLKNEAELLPYLAELGKMGRVKYMINLETYIETWGLPNMDSSTGKFFGAPVAFVKPPIKYERIIAGFFKDPKKEQFDFLANIRSERFLELQKITGAYQGKKKLNRNQLLDAFHLWCAEYHQCDYFLTLDFKLIRMLSQKRNASLLVQAVRPSGLLKKILTDSANYQLDKNYPK